MSQVVIRLRAPNGASDYYMLTPIELSVACLKSRIAEEHPSHPLQETQKLVFAGAILKDANILAHVFAKYKTDKPISLHLLFPASSANTDAPPNDPAPLLAPPPQPPPPPPSSSSSQPTIPPSSSTPTPPPPTHSTQPLMTPPPASESFSAGFTFSPPPVSAVYSPRGSPTLMPATPSAASPLRMQAHVGASNANVSTAMQDYYARYYAAYYEAWYKAALADALSSSSGISPPPLATPAGPAPVGVEDGGNDGEEVEEEEGGGEAEVDAPQAVPQTWMGRGWTILGWAIPLLSTFVKFAVLLSFLVPSSTVAEMAYTAGIVFGVIIFQAVIRWYVNRQQEVFNEQVQTLRQAQDAEARAREAALQAQDAAEADPDSEEAAAARAQAQEAAATAAEASAAAQDMLDRAEQARNGPNIFVRMAKEVFNLFAPLIMSIFPAYRPPDRLPEHLLPQPPQPQVPQD